MGSVAVIKHAETASGSVVSDRNKGVNGVSKWGQGANLDKFSLSPSLPAYHGACVLNFPALILDYS